MVKYLAFTLKFALGILLLASCNIKKPLNYAQYVSFSPMTAWDRDTAVTMQLDVPKDEMAKSVYNLYFTVQVKQPHHHTSNSTIALNFKFISPDNNEYTHQLKIPTESDDPQIDMVRKNGIMEMTIPYARKITNLMDGSWKIYISKEAGYSLNNQIIGLGFHLTKENEQ